VRGRTTVDLLEPQTSADEYSQQPVADWTKIWTVYAGISAAVESIDTTEATVVADTIISQYRLIVPPGTNLTSDWRVVWRGDTYTILGDVIVAESSRHDGEEFRRCVLKKVTR
jgi:hypothetical protein